MVKKRNNVYLGPNDAALIFRMDGSQELRLPNEEAPEGLPAGNEAVRCAVFLDCEDLVDAVNIRMKRILDNMCPKCNVCMVGGKAIQNTLTPGIPDFPGGDPWGCGQTLNYGGPGKIIDCWKCPKCGYSFSKSNKTQET